MTSILLVLFSATSLQVEPLRAAANLAYAIQRSQIGVKECEVGVDVEVADAGRKGRGVFALKPIAAGALIGRYSAPVVRKDKASLLNDGTYRFNLEDNAFALDAVDPARSNWCRYMNHARGERANVDSVPAVALGINYGVVFQASCPIAAGEELRFDYGEEHWDEVYPFQLDPRRLLVDYF